MIKNNINIKDGEDGMRSVAIVKMRLKEGKTYEDFRKAGYHTTGFGTKNKMFSLINA